MSDRVVFTFLIQMGLQEVVREQMGTLERDIDVELCEVASVERFEAFFTRHFYHTVHHTFVRTVVHLKPLLYHF